MQDATKTSKEHPFLLQLREIIVTNFSNEQFGVEVLAEACHMSRAHLYKKVKALTGSSVSSFIKKVRLEEAYELLKSQKYSIAEVAHRVGFGSTSYFTTSFKKHFGFSPSDRQKLEAPKLYSSGSVVKDQWVKGISNQLLLATIVILLIVSGVVIGTSLVRSEDMKDPSIAVIRFDDLSEDQSLRNFSDGLGEEIINSLCKIRSLKVTARNSSFQFSRNDDPSSIKKALGVNNFIEGSVRRNGDLYRVTVQLVDANTGFHLWSQNFDRPNKDILAFQEEISRFVADKMRIKLTSEEELALGRRMTTDSVAFRLYQEAIRLSRESNSRGNRKAIIKMKQAIALDSNFAKAHTWIVNFYGWSSYISEMKPEQAQELMQYHVDKALFLEPNMADAHIAKGQLEVARKDYHSALASFNLAIELEPSNDRAYGNLSYVLRYFQREKEAYDHWFKARSLDPLKANLNHSIAQYHYYIKRDYNKGVNTIRNFLETSPRRGFSRPFLEVFRASLPSGDASTAVINLYQAYANDPEDLRNLYWLANSSTWLDLVPLNKLAVDQMNRLDPDRVTTRACLTTLNARFGLYEENLRLVEEWHKKGLANSKEWLHYTSKSLIPLGKSDLVRQLISDSIPEIFEANYLDNAENFDPDLVSKLDILEDYIMALRELGETEEADLFATMVVEYLENEMQRLEKDDILDYRRALSYKLIQASVTDDVEAAINILEQTVFKDKHLLNMNNRIKVSTRLYRIRKDPRFKNFSARYDVKIAPQREEVIRYLKEKGVWLSTWGH